MKVRNFLAGALMLAATQALAYPTIGDKAEWTGTMVTQDGMSVPVIVIKEVMSYDETTMKWTVHTTKMVGDKVENETKEMFHMYTPEKYQKMIQNCVVHGGTLEDVTVGAGTYSVCSMERECGHVKKAMSYGDVPFGIVKKMVTDEMDGSVKTMELTSVTLGQ